MQKTRFVIVVLLLLHSAILFSPKAIADQRAISSLSELQDETLFLGDVVELQTGVCWASKKPSNKASKKKLQVFINNQWVGVGRTKFVPNTQCTGNIRKPFEQIFIWEVDRLGEVNNRFKYLGTLRIRNSAVFPSEFMNITVLESREKLREYEASQSLDFYNWVNCQMNGGQWDESRGLCVGGSRP